MKNEAAQSLGALGGAATLKKRGKEYFKELSIKGIEARKKKAEAKNEVA